MRRTSTRRGWSRCTSRSSTASRSGRTSSSRTVPGDSSRRGRTYPGRSAGSSSGGSSCCRLDLVRGLRRRARDDAQRVVGGRSGSRRSTARRRASASKRRSSRSSRSSSSRLRGRWGRRRSTVATGVLAALLAWLGLVKFTYLGLGSAVVLLVTVAAPRHPTPRRACAPRVRCLVAWLVASRRSVSWRAIPRLHRQWALCRCRVHVRDVSLVQHRSSAVAGARCRAQ